MRIINTTSSPITLTDIDRGIANGEGKEMYESWNSKADNGVPANDYIDVLDTEKVMLSAELGQVSKLVAANYLATKYSVTGTNVGPFTVTNANKVFAFTLGTTPFSVTLPTGSLTTVAVAHGINLTVGGVSGFVAEESKGFFRSSNMSPITDYSQIQGPIGYGYGQRGPSILTGFLVMSCDVPITIGAGTANALLGFHASDFTKCK